jgi:DNA-binding CsgD family transcriptional regulator
MSNSAVWPGSRSACSGQWRNRLGPPHTASEFRGTGRARGFDIPENGDIAVTRREEVLSLLARHPDGLTDAELARLIGATHQTVNQTCRRLASEHLIRRDDLGRPIMNFATDDPPPIRPQAASAHDEEWFWEGNVQSLVVRHLASRGATLRSVVDTATRARGTDIVAVLDGRVLHVEVKGWPSTHYADPRRAGEVKPTQPTLQATHWFAGAVLSALRLRGKHPADRVVTAFPDFTRYRNLAAETAAPLRTIGIEIWLVTESGDVTIHNA